MIKQVVTRLSIMILVLNVYQLYTLGDFYSYSKISSSVDYQDNFILKLGKIKSINVEHDKENNNFHIDTYDSTMISTQNFNFLDDSPKKIDTFKIDYQIAFFFFIKLDYNVVVETHKHKNKLNYKYRLDYQKTSFNLYN